MSSSTSLKDPVNEVEGPYSFVPSGGRSVAVEYQQILPETNGVFWNDDFFDDEDVIAVFDFDYDKMIEFNLPSEMIKQLLLVGGVSAYFAIFFFEIFPPLVLIPPILYLLSLTPCLLSRQVRWQAEAHHVAITQDGIRFVQDRQKAGWGWSICDRGKHSKTVPFDKITDCDIIEPAGNQFLIIPRILFTINVDTASSGTEKHKHELEITGLKDPYGFKKLVWAMKRNTHPLPTAVTNKVYQPPHQKSSQLELSDLAQLTKTASGSSQSSGGVRGLLRDIRDELRQNNQLLRGLKQRENETDRAAIAQDAAVGSSLV